MTKDRHTLLRGMWQGSSQDKGLGIVLGHFLDIVGLLSIKTPPAFNSFLPWSEERTGVFDIQERIDEVDVVSWLR